MEILNSKLVFFDDYWIDFRKNVIKRWYKPTKLSEYIDPNLNSGGCYNTVSWSPEHGKYLMWYEYLVDPNDDEARYMSLAESDDGINWRPLNLRSDADAAANIFANTVYTGNTGLHGCYVYRDEQEADPQMRYKMAGATRAARYREAGIQNSSVYLSTSPDGINWTERADCMIHPHTSDTTNCIFFNPVTGEYNAIIRAGFVDRRICMTKSKDLKSWSRPQVIVHPDAGFGDDAYAVQLYGMTSHWMGGYFTGSLWRYFTSLVDFDYSRMLGFMDCELVYSYDGEHWMRASREPFIDRPLAPEFGFSSMHADDFYLSADGQRQFIMCTGSRTMHSATVDHERLANMVSGPRSAAMVYEIRRDGFCGLDASTTDGLVTTKSFELLGDDVLFNLRAPCGCARFAFISHEGKPYEGFDFEDCIPFSGDSLNHRPVFKNHDISELKGKRVRISVTMDSAVLHCIEAAMRPYIRYPQVSMNDPVHVTE